jgi:large subunit ribosomal protein L54
VLTFSAAKSKKQRRIASKAARALKTGMVGTSHVVKVPLEEQSIDLPAGMGADENTQAQEAREELNEAMRKARRRRIKESNFLRGMR